MSDVAVVSLCAVVADDVGPLLEAIEGLRSDMREDFAAVRAEIRDVESRVSDSVTNYTLNHAQEHAVQAAVATDRHAQINAFIEGAKLDQARRDGALGIVRYVFELVSTHSGAIVKVILAVAGALLVVNGNLNVSVQ